MGKKKLKLKLNFVFHQANYQKTETLSLKCRSVVSI